MSFVSNAQTSVNDPLLIAKVHQYAAEVYKDCTLFAEPQYMPEYIEEVSRVKVIKEAFQPNEQYKLLSSFKLKNKCNMDMVTDNANTINPDNFNSLKYFFNFYSKTIQKIRVDNSPYVIIILPKQ